MLKNFDVVVLENVETNDVEGGYIVAKVNDVVYSLFYDFGDTLCGIECDNKDFVEYSEETNSIIEAIYLTISLNLKVSTIVFDSINETYSLV